MGVRAALSDAEWARIEPVVSALTSRGPKGVDDRRFVEATVWILRTGAPWRDLPDAFGKFEGFVAVAAALIALTGWPG